MSEIIMGAHSYGRPQLRVWQPDVDCIVGKYTSIAPKVEVLLGGEHRTDFVTTYPMVETGFADSADCKLDGYSKGDVVIGSDVWIGQEARILSGVHVGDGAVIGAFSVVASDVPPYAVVAGNPAELIRYRFTPEQILALLRIRWWDWPDEEVKLAAPLLTGDVETFLEVYG